MTKDDDKIIIYRSCDREIYNLVDKIGKTEYGVLSFDSQDIKEIKIKGRKPYQIITIEKSTLLSDERY